MYSSLPERVMEVEKESSGDHFPPQTGCFYFRDSFRECRLLMNKTFLPEWCYISILGFLINQQSTLKIRQTDGLQLGTQGILFTLFFCGPTLPSPIFCQTWKGLCWLCFHVFFFFFSENEEDFEQANTLRLHSAQIWDIWMLYNNAAGLNC